MIKRHIACLFLVLLATFGSRAEIRFVRNAGQWKKGDYKVKLNGGDLFFRNGSIIWQNRPTLHQMQDMASKGQRSFQLENIFLNLAGANPAPAHEGSRGFGTQYNFFITDGTGAPHMQSTSAFGQVDYHDVYPGIDQTWYERDETLEFDFSLQPGADPDRIRLEAQGALARLTDGSVLLQGKLGSMTLQKPVAYQSIDGKRIVVSCRYRVEGNAIRFILGKYDRSFPLTIDPQLTFATLSGSRADNWGTTATFDQTGNSYGAGIVFNSGFPTTPGVIDAFFNGPADELGGTNVDVGIEKFSTDGRQLLYATYFGGPDVEVPHSMVCDAQGNLFVLLSTSSRNLFQQFRGGPRVQPYDFDYLTYENGCDLYVIKVSPTGNAVLSVGAMSGTFTDGMLDQGNGLLYNYGDQFRGEVVCDAAGNVYVATNTKSNNLATTGAFQTQIRGRSDALVVKFGNNLGVPFWSTYLGGAYDDAAYGIRALSSGKVVVCGGSASPDFPTTAGSWQSTAIPPRDGLRENQVNAWVALLDRDGRNLIASTFISSSEYDQAFFIEEKAGQSFFVYGQTTGNITRRVNSFGSASGGQFIYRFDSTLRRLENACRFGRRINQPDISPSALTVDSCGQVYLAGWGASLGRTWPRTSLSSAGMPISRDGYQQRTDGSDFYFMVLNADFTSLKYGTYYGGNGSDEHVDGGTSRFDKNGVIYQSVCADCGGTSLFPTSPGVYGPENLSSNCNMGLVKFNFSPLAEPLKLNVTPDSICPGLPITITHNAAGNNNFQLTALPSGENLSSTSPLLYRPPGDSLLITIQLIGNGPGCSNIDTLERQVKLLDKPTVDDRRFLFCPGDTLHAEYPPQYRYTWSPVGGLASDTASSQTIVAGLERHYLVAVQNRLTTCRDTTDVWLQNRTGSVHVAFLNQTEPCSFQRKALVSVDSQFRPNRWLVNGIEYLDRDTIQLDLGQDSLFASIRSLSSCYMFDSIDVTIPLRRPSFDTTYTVQVRGVDCSNLKRSIRANGRPDTLYWVTPEQSLLGTEISLGGEAQNLMLIQTTAGCPDTARIDLPEIGFMIPNILTLNDDGQNDRLQIENLDFEKFHVYTRWGTEVYEQSGSQDGKTTTRLQWTPGRDAAPGTYFFAIKLRDSSTCRGWIELVR